MAKAGGGGRGSGGGGGPNSPVRVGGRTTTLRNFLGDVTRTRDAINNWSRTHRPGVKPRGRISTALDKLNSVRFALETAGQSRAVSDAAKVVARFERSGVQGVAFRDLHF